MQIHDAYAWGDLHELGDTWIFNGAPTRDSRMAWVYEPPALGMKVLVVLSPDSVFSRRGVAVIPKAHAELNQPAKEYL